MPVPLKARRPFPYAGRSLKAGESFCALTSSDAHVLITIGHAEAVPPQGQQYLTRVMRPTPEVTLEQMGVEELKALAARLNVRVHWKAGAEKLRIAIRNRG